MSGRWRNRKQKAVRPEMLEDVEKEGDEEQKVEMDEDEETKGEQPGVVEVPENKKQEEKEGDGRGDPMRIAPEEVGGRMRNIGDPRLPSQKEVADHYLTHVPYRNWCPHCVRGRGKDLDHRKGLDEDRCLREFSFDYCFPGDEKGVKITVLVGRERVTGMTMASVVPVKGTLGQFAAMKVLDFIKECGAAEAEVILKADQEPAIEALMADVVKTRGAAITVIEKSPVGSSGSNGVVERAVQTVEGLMRTLKSACEERMNTKIKPDDKLVIFMAEYASYLLNRLDIGKDGKTAHERCRGKRATVMAVEFGEKLLWKIRQKSKLEKLNPRWDFGVFVGVKADSGELWVATKAGLQSVRSVRRLPLEDRWGAANKDFVKHVPWNRSGEDPDADGDLPEGVEVPAAAGGDAVDAGGAARVVLINTREPAPKEFYIKKRDVEAHGHTKGCAGCRAMFQGGTWQNHSAECRERFRGLLKDEDRVKRMEEKRKDYEDKAEEEAQRKEEKRRRKEERKAEERGKKRVADDDALDDERIHRKAPDEGEDEEVRPAPQGEKRKAEEGLSTPGSSGDGSGGDGNGMEVEAVTHGGEGAWDDVRGGWLNRDEVRKARMEEVGYMQKERLWDVVPRQKADGQRVVSVKWVDTNKGTDDKPEVRCRLVARDFKGPEKDREDLFAATPPWELKRLLMSHAAEVSGGKVRKMLLIDVKKAHLNSECKDDVYIELPEEVGAGANQVGKLRRWLYGFRPAAAAWENHYAAKLVEVGFERGMSSPVSFYHDKRDVNLVVHGDDFTFTGSQSELEWAEVLMERWYKIKVRARLGPEDCDDKDATLLGRRLRWHEWGISCESDPKYRKHVIESLGLTEDSKSLTVTGAKEADGKEQGLPRVMGDDKQYRSIVASVNYMATDQPDLQYACKEACRDMSAPTEASWQKLKKIARYLVGREKVVWRYPWKVGHGRWRACVDSDWAGDVETRKSTSGGLIMLGDHCVKTWSTTQSSPALSSCEAEYYALVDGASRALGVQAAAKELGIAVEDLTIEAATDSSAAKSYASRRGAGRVRHVEVRQLWLQQAVADGKFRLVKIPGLENPADVLTKYKALHDFRSLLAGVNVEVVAKAPGQGGGGDGGGGVKMGWKRLEEGVAWADAEDEGEEGLECWFRRVTWKSSPCAAYGPQAE